MPSCFIESLKLLEILGNREKIYRIKVYAARHHEILGQGAKTLNYFVVLVFILNVPLKAPC